MISAATIAVLFISLVESHPHLYQDFYSYNFPNQYSSFLNYANGIPSYSPSIPTYSDFDYQDNVLASYLSLPDVLPTLNVLAETPYVVGNSFTVVPMLVVSKKNMKMVSNVHITEVSKKKPTMTVKTEENTLLKCTPAVKIILDQPVVVYSLKTSIVFPSQVMISHRGYRIPIRVGAVIAPIAENTYVSVETPVEISVVYAVPTKPVTVDYINFDDIIDVPDSQSVIVDSDDTALPPKNITVINFPEKEAEPVLAVDEEGEELVNRNPPEILAPAGIVQSTQPDSSVEPFHNSKESPLLSTLREDSKKKRL